MSVVPDEHGETGASGPLAVMATKRWATLMRYVRRQVRAKLPERDIDDITADVQLDLAEHLATGTVVASLHRLADCAVGKYVERWYRRRGRWTADVALEDVAADLGRAQYDDDAPCGGDGCPRPPIEAMTAWWLLRGDVERAVVRAVWVDDTLAMVARGSGRSGREVRRVVAELPAKIARRRRGGGLKRGRLR